jgi:hypothetical protein
VLHATNALWAALSWLVPGLGHLLRGERAKGLIYAAVLIGCFAAGQIMSEYRAVSRAEHDIAFWAQIGAGGPALLGAWYDATRHARETPPHPIAVPWLLDCGIMYTCVAGLLNFVLVVDLLFPRPGSARAAGRAGRAARTPSDGGAGRD